MIRDRGTSRLPKCVTQNSHIIITIAGIAPSVYIYTYIYICVCVYIYIYIYIATWEFLMTSWQRKKSLNLAHRCTSLGWQCELKMDCWWTTAPFSGVHIKQKWDRNPPSWWNIGHCTGLSTLSEKWHELCELLDSGKELGQASKRRKIERSKSGWLEKEACGYKHANVKCQVFLSHINTP